jgi:very-short-patch-repair endonuclease
MRRRQLEGFRFRRQVPIGPFIVDFLCPKARLVVELDGGQHADRADYDRRRTRWLESKGYRVLRYWNHDVLLHPDVVLADIHRHLMERATPPQPSPSPAAKGREQCDAT